MTTSPRVVVVGCGGIARAHLGAIPPSHIVALCDSAPLAAHRLLADFELQSPLFDSLGNAIKSQKPDVAIVCTPPATHFELASTALQAGLNVLCEKPLTLSTRDADALVEAARARNLTLRTSAKYRFCAGVQAAKTLLDSGETGALQSLSIAFGAHFDYARSWHSNISLSGGGVWMDNGPHALDLARHFAGALHVETIKNWQTEAGLETEGRVCLRSIAGVSVEIALSWKRSLGDHFVVLGCERGTLEIGWRETLWHPQNAPSRVLTGAYNKVDCFSAQWQAFLNNDPLLALEDGPHTIQLIEAIYSIATAIPPKNMAHQAT